MLEILINEQQYRRIISEAKKEDILVNKLGLSENDANEVVRICGALSIWMMKKLLSFYVTSLKNIEDSDPNIKDVLSDVKGKLIPSIFKKKLKIFQDLTSAMDYIRVGLNGNIKTIESLNFYEIIKESEEWHKELQIGDDKIDYKEEGNVLVDFRDENGIGFYWVDLETSYSSEECERMGHCGRTAGTNTIISLREFKPLPNGHTLNKSHLTAAVGQGYKDGVIFQLKGPKNTKPSEKYFPYIVKLILSEDADITGFGSEYASHDDFKLTDLSKDDLQLIYSEKPDLFKRRSDKKALMKYGIIDAINYNYELTLHLRPDEFDKLVDGNYKIRKDPWFFKTLMDDSWEVMNDYYDNDSWKYYYDDINESNLKRIDELVEAYIKENTFDEEDIGDLEGAELLEYIDYDDVINAIRTAENDARNDAYIEYYQDQLKEALEEFGTVSDFNYSGATIHMNLEDTFLTIENNDPDFFEEVAERCDDDVKCMFFEFLADRGGIEKSKYSPDDRYIPSIDDDVFNDHLEHRLSDI